MPAARPLPGRAAGRMRGLAGLWRARRSFVYRFEVARLAGRRGPARRILILLVAASYPASALFAAGWPDLPAYILAFVVLWTLPLATLVSACGAGARTFAGERARGTLDALMMTPLDRYELVAGRLAARLRPHLALLATFLGTWAVAGLVTMAAAGADPDLAVALLIPVTLVLSAGAYVSLLLLGAALGTYFSLRMESAAGALAAALALFLAIGVADFLASLIGMFIGMVLLAILGLVFGEVGPLAGLLLLLAGVLLVCFLHLLVASLLLRSAARRFDAWGRGVRG